MRRIIGMVTALWVQCPECKGLEEVYDPERQDWVTCPMCNGRGEVQG